MSESTLPKEPITTPPPTTLKLLSQRSATDDAPAWATLALAESDYKLHLALSQPLPADVGEKLTGKIFCDARKVMVMPAGGRFIEPGEGRPRRIQARIVGGSVSENRLYLQAGPGLYLTAALKAPGQKADEFMVGQLVGFDVFAGASFEPA